MTTWQLCFSTLNFCPTKLDVGFAYKPTSKVNKEWSKKRGKKTCECKNKMWKSLVLSLIFIINSPGLLKGGRSRKSSICLSVSATLLHWTFSFIWKSHKTKDWMEVKSRKWWHADLMFGHWLNVSSHLGVQPPWFAIFMSNLWPFCWPQRLFGVSSGIR